MITTQFWSAHRALAAAGYTVICVLVVVVAVMGHYL